MLFVDEERRLKAEKAVEKAIPILLKTQVEIGGKKTVWAAQYDETTLKPAAARKFEPVSLTAGESVGIVRFLMLDSTPDQATIDAIESAIKWFRANKINGIRWERKNGENVVVKDKTAPPIWARFYQIETMKPIFIGRDARHQIRRRGNRSRAPQRLRVVCFRTERAFGKRLSEVEREN